MTVHSYQLFEPDEAGPPPASLPPPPAAVTPIPVAAPGGEPSAHDHLMQFIHEFGADEAAGSTDLVLDLTGDEPVVILPLLPPPPAPAPTNGDHRQTVLPPVLNRARYRRVGIDGVSTRPGEISELATLVDDAGEPDVLRLILAAQRRSRHPSAGRPSQPE